MLAIQPADISYAAIAAAEAAAYADNHRRLALLMTDAILTDPRRVVPTPVYDSPTHRSRRTAAYEAMSELTEVNAVRVCELLAACDSSTDPKVRLLAQSILADIANQYATAHAEF